MFSPVGRHLILPRPDHWHACACPCARIPPLLRHLKFEDEGSLVHWPCERGAAAQAAQSRARAARGAARPHLT